MQCKIVNSCGTGKGTAEVVVQEDDLIIRSPISLETGDTVIDAVPAAMRPIKSIQT